MSTETEDLELLRGLLEKATPGPWSIYKHFNAPEGLHTWEIKGETRDDDIADGMLKEDAVLIAALRNALPSLLSRTQAAEKALEEAQEIARCAKAGGAEAERLLGEYQLRALKAEPALEEAGKENARLREAITDAESLMGDTRNIGMVRLGLRQALQGTPS